MNRVSIKTQKILMFIPYVNIINLFIWLYISTHQFKEKNTFLRSLWILFSTLGPLVFAQVTLSQFLPTLGTLMSYANIYMIPFVLGYRFIRYQETLVG